MRALDPRDIMTTSSVYSLTAGQNNTAPALRVIYDLSALYISFHAFTLTYNKLSKGLCVFGVLSEERAPSSVIIPEPGVLPPTGERGPSSACSPDPECSPRVLLPVLG